MALGDNFTDLAFSWGPDIQRGTQAMQQFYEDRSPLNDVQKSVLRGLGGLGDTGPALQAAPALPPQAPPAMSEGLGAPFNPMSQARPGPDNPPWMPSPQQAMPDSELLAVQSPPSAARPAPVQAPMSAADKILAMKKPGATSGNVSVSKKGPMQLSGLDPDKLTQKDWQALVQMLPMLQSQMKLDAAPDKFTLEQFKAAFNALRDEGNNAFKGGEGDKNRDLQQQQVDETIRYHKEQIRLGFARLREASGNVRALVAGRNTDAKAWLDATKLVDNEIATHLRDIASARGAISKMQADPTLMAKRGAQAQIDAFNADIAAAEAAIAEARQDPAYVEAKRKVMSGFGRGATNTTTRILDQSSRNAPVGAPPPLDGGIGPPKVVSTQPVGTRAMKYDRATNKTRFFGDAAGTQLIGEADGDVRPRK